MRNELVVLLLAISTLAHADPVPDLPGEREAAAAFDTTVDFEHRVRWQSELAMFVGAAPIDHVQTSTSPAYSLATGIHCDRITVLAEYAIAGISIHAPSSTSTAHGDVQYVDTYGMLHRLGVAARYSFVKLTSGEGIAKWFGEAWLEGGVGAQIARWDQGGTFERPDLAFGLGLQGARRGSARSRGGAFVALRVELGRRTDVEYAPATCSAPCTSASPPAAWSDRSALLHVGFLFGD